MGMDCLTRILVIALLVLAGSLEGYRYLAMEEDYSQRSYGGLTQMWENTPYGPRPMMCRQPEETLRPDANPI